MIMRHHLIKKLKAQSTQEDGFMLVEDMVVLVIIGLLTTFVVINVLPAQDRALVSKTKADIRIIEQALEMYRFCLLYTSPSPRD